MARALPKEEEAFEPETPDFTIVTGLSGAGRSEVANALEDLGYFVVDNLPPSLMPKMVELAVVPGQEIKHIALVVDVRGGTYFDQVSEALRDLARRGIEYRIVFLTASDDVLIRRFEATKRKHPLADRVLDGMVPGFLHEGKRYLTIAIGCTGGRHRSVVLAEAIAESLRRRGLNVAVRHRDLERE